MFIYLKFKFPRVYTKIYFISYRSYGHRVCVLEPILLCTHYMSIKKHSSFPTRIRAFSFSQAVPRLSSTLLACWMALPPIPQNLVSLGATHHKKVTLNTFSYNAKKRDNFTPSKNEIAPDFIVTFPYFFAFLPAVADHRS